MTLIGYWPLTESNGSTAYDYSGNENHASITDGGDSTVPGGTGILGQSAYSFDGSNDSVEYLNDIITGPTDFSISLWVYPTATNGREIFRSHSGDWQDISIRYGTNDQNKIFVMFADNSTDSKTSTTSSSSISTNEWSHIAVSFNQDNDKVILYINGVEEGALTEAWDSNVNMYLGQDHNNNRHFSGKMMDVRIYNRVLSRSEIQYLYNVSNRGSIVTETKKS